MKKRERLLYLLLGPLLCFSCINEDLSLCPGNLYLELQYKKSTTQFDELIANEVSLYLYQDNLLDRQTEIPFESVKGGKQYRLSKDVMGELELIGWTVPVTETTPGAIPPGTIGKAKEETILQLEQVSTEDRELYHPPAYLHRGSYRWKEADLTSDTYVSLSVAPAVCRLRVILHDNGNYPVAEKPGLEISGLQKELSMDLQPLGDDVLIWGSDKLVYGENRWETDSFIFLPPSLPERPLSFIIRPQDRPAFIVHTRYVSTPDDHLHLELRSDGDVEFSVNNWRQIILIEGL